MNIYKLLKAYVNRQYHNNSRLILFLLNVSGRGGHWTRKVLNREIYAFLDSLPLDNLTAAEISGRHFMSRAWKSYDSLCYPDFDLCLPYTGSKKYDVIFCEQVLEHVVDPQRALITLNHMLNPNGILIVSTPFLIKIHQCPKDYWRFTPDGLKLLIERADLSVERLCSWGNRSCIRANLTNKNWAKYWPLRSLYNEDDFPVVVWAYARKKGDLNP